VAQREILVKLRDRNFLISTGIMIAAIVASLAVSGFLAGRTTTVTVAAAGPGAAQVIQEAGTVADAANKKVSFTTHTVADEAAVDLQVRAGTAEVGLLPNGSGGWKLVGKNTKNDNAATYLGAAVQQLTVQRNAVAVGTSMAALAKGGAVSYSLLETSAVDPGLAKVVAIVFAILFYISSVLFGMAIAQSVVEEKQNRIVEILASAIPVRQLLIGKVIGNTIMALGQLVLFVGAGLIGLSAIGKGAMLGQIAGAAGWFIVFFIVGFLALAGLWAVAGALSTRSEDLQSTATPLTMAIMLVMFLGIFLTGTARTIASYVPIVSIVSMPGRLAEGAASWWEPLPALVLMVAATYGIVLVAEKIYRRSLMQTGGRLTIRQALRVED
jgi:ABC-2 type transport system permease protein